MINGAINRRFRYNEIGELRRISINELGVGLKSGVQAYNFRVGMFYFDSIGNVLMSSTDDDNMVLIKCVDGTQVIISSDDPDMFMRVIKMMNNSCN